MGNIKSIPDEDDSGTSSYEDVIKVCLTDDWRKAKFASLCEALERNDPKRKFVGFLSDPANISYPNGYGKRLGEALKYNTHATTLCLDLSSILGNSNEAVEVNDDRVVDSNDRMVVAAKTTTNSTTATSTTIHCDLLLHFIAHSSTLTKLDLADYKCRTRDGSPTPLLDELFERVTMNPSIEEVELGCHMQVPLAGLATFLQTTTSLRTLQLGLESIIIVDDDLDLLGQAFRRNTSLENLKFTCNNNDTLLSYVLPQLRNHPTLRTLLLSHMFNPTGIELLPEAISSLLRATKLQELTMGLFSFDEIFMASLVNALQLSNTSLTHLSLRHCDLDSDAMRLFVKFVQQLGTNMNTCRLQNLEFYSTFRPIHARQGVQDNPRTPPGIEAAAMLVGSQIACFKLFESPPLYQFESSALLDFCKVILQHAPQVYVQDLHLSAMDDAAWAAFIACIPHLLYLQKLTVPPFHHETFLSKKNSTSFIRALRQNGSINQVQMYKEDPQYGKIFLMPGRDYFYENEEMLVRAYCRRNESLNQLLSQTLRPSTKKRECRVVRMSNRLWLQRSGITLFPRLFLCAQQAPNMGANSILIGLLSSADHVGPDHHPQNGKRLLS